MLNKIKLVSFSKFVLFIFMVFLIGTLESSCTTTKHKKSDVSFSKEGQYIPPGTVWLMDKIYIDQFECDNQAYKTYLYFVKEKFGKSSQEFQSAIPVIFRDPYNAIHIDNEVFKIHDSLYFKNDTTEMAVAYNYFIDPKNEKSPMINVSFDQANAYCKFRSDVVNLGIYAQENKTNVTMLDISDDIPQKVVYRLPTKEEWEYASKSQNASHNAFIPVPLNHTPDFDGKNVDVDYRKNGTMVIRNPDDRFKKKRAQDLMIYNLFSNVSEMTSKRGLAIGSNFKSVNSANDSSTPTYSYSQGEDWLGFRCVCTVLGNVSKND